jgi:SNF2 family DNA or RNA helicase
MLKMNNLVYTTTPYQHQQEALEKAWGNTGFAYFLEQGTGKSKIVVDETVNLIERGLINCVIILAPNGVHENWVQQFELHGPKNYDKWYIQVFRSKNKGEKQEQLTRDIINSGKVLVFLMNIEALSHKKGQDYLYRILRARRHSYVCVDESHKIKTPSATRTKAAIKLGELAKYRRITTGTEAEEGIHNLFAQFKFLDWKIIGHKFITSFRNMYCVMGGFENREIIGFQNKEILAASIAPFAYNKRKRDCLDLPDKVYVKHRIAMTPEQEDMYDRLEEDLLLELDNGDVVDATMAITRIMRLQQVLCGHITDQTILSNRANYVVELVEQASSKCIVFCRFIKDVSLVTTALASYGIGSIGIVGGTDNMLEQVNSWRNGSHIKALVITVQTGGLGLTLNEANTMIFYSNTYSSTDRLQAEDRAHRIGQTNKVTIHDIVVRGKIDDIILRVLKNKANLAERFRELLKEGKLQQFLKGETE